MRNERPRVEPEFFVGLLVAMGLAAALWCCAWAGFELAARLLD